MTTRLAGWFNRHRKLIDRVSLVATGVVLALTLFALSRFLRNADLSKIWGAIVGIPWQQLLASVGFAAGGYIALIGYDWSAMRYIGRRVPFAGLALASFCSYAIGNTAGFSLLSGGTVRLRLYSRVGLDLPDIGRVTVFCIVAFGFGICAVGALSVLISPTAFATITSLPQAGVMAAGFSAVVGIVAFVIFCGSGRTVTLLGWQVTTPSALLVTQQLIISAADLLLSSAALFVLLPHGTALSFIDFLPIYCAALTVGIMSHVPGGLGVFEASMLFALHDEVGSEQLVGALLVFRVLYYIVPAGLSLLIMATIEFRDQLRQAQGGSAALGKNPWPAVVGGIALAALLLLIIGKAAGAEFSPPGPQLADHPGGAGTAQSLATTRNSWPGGQ